jgi:hypothetical protein
MKMDVKKVSIEYIPSNDRGWIKGKFRIIYPIEVKNS